MTARAILLLILFAPVIARGQNMAAFAADEEAMQYAPPATSSDWWLSGGVSAANCVAAYAAKGAASQAASYDNLASTATNYNLIAVGSPVWASTNGWSGFSAANYLNTQITPSSASQSWTAIAKYAGGVATAAQAVLGYNRTTARWQLLPISSATQRQYANGGGSGFLITSGRSTSGVMAFAGRNAYYNGSPDGTIPSDATGTAGPVYIGARNGASGPEISWGGSISSVAIYSSTLTSNQVQAIGAAMP